MCKPRVMPWAVVFLIMLSLMAVGHAGERRRPHPPKSSVVLTPEEMEQTFAEPPPAQASTPAPSAPETPLKSAYNSLPMTIAEMGEYDRIAMEPYAETYDALPLAEKADLYARQFEFMNNRPPNFPPEIARSIRGEADAGAPADVDAGYAEDAAFGHGVPEAYDELPRSMADMGRHDRIAMGPYKDTYDDLPIAEQAELYSRQFQFMNDRPPNYSPETLAQIRGEAVAPSRRAAPSGPGVPAGSAAYDVLPRSMADMNAIDSIAMEPYLDTYDDLPIEEQAELYSRQFQFMNDRPPNFHPAVLAEIRGEPYDGPEFAEPMEAAPLIAMTEPEPAAIPEEPSDPRRGSLRPPPPKPVVYDEFPRRMADMSRDDRLAMEPFREKYDTMPLTEKAMTYAKQFKKLHDRFPKFRPAVMAEIGLSQYTSVDIEAMGLKEVADALKNQAGEEYDELPLTMADMNSYTSAAMDPYRYGYDRFSIAEKALRYSVKFESLYGRPPRFHPSVAAKIERSRQGLPEDEPFIGGGESIGESQTMPARLPPSGVYDALPRRMVEMTEYDRIAMDPYKETYDTLPLAEKARLYATQFEYMQGREPIFSPAVEAEILQNEDAPDPKTAKKTRRDFYKPVAPGQHKTVGGIDANAIPGPWNQNAAPNPTPSQGEVITVNPDGSVYQEHDDRMESLRQGQGWNIF